LGVTSFYLFDTIKLKALLSMSMMVTVKHPQPQNFICWHFRTLCLFHLHRRCQWEI